jgi:hypothetical protein
MPRRHPDPVGAVKVPTYRDLDPVLSVSAVAAYYGVTKGLASKWARERSDWPAPFATPPSGALYLTADVIAWGQTNERKRAEGPRPAGDPRPPSVARASRRGRKAAA